VNATGTFDMSLSSHASIVEASLDPDAVGGGEFLDDGAGVA
jgi:hypothetical protein